MRTFWIPSPGRTFAGARTPRHGRSSAGRPSLPDGGDPTIWEHYGDIANAQGLKNEARTGWERALELDHPNPETIRKKLNSL